MGNRIRQLRDQYRLTLKRLSESTGIDYTTLSRIENGERGLNEQYLKILSDYFHVSTDYLLGRSDTPNEAKEEELDDYKFALYGEVRDLTPAEKDEILRLVKFYASELKNKKK